jgi:hypothetical protein
MSSENDGLGSFRIADLRRPVVRGGGGKAPAAPEPAAASSIGFPAVERVLESGSIEALASSLRPSYEQLDALATGGDMRARAAAKKAMAAYERTADLFEYLFETKRTLEGK